jgi:hypothetical protein
VTLRWTWTCLGTGRESCTAAGDGSTGINKHLDETQHGVLMRGVPR